MTRSPLSRVHSARSRLAALAPRCARLALLAAALGACASDDAVKDQASGTIDKSPASWSEPGAMADPPPERLPDAALLDGSLDAASMCTDASLAGVTLAAGSSACSFIIDGAPADADAQLFTVELDGQPLTSGYQISGSTLTLTGSTCASWQGPADAGADAGRDAGADAGAHMLTIRYQACVSPEQ